MLVRHIPHSSTVIPAEYRGQFLIDDYELQSEILRLTDWYTDKLYADLDSEQVVFPISRIICDPERFLDDDLEAASKVGMGVFYTHGTKGQVIRFKNKSLRDQIIQEYYLPHHSSLSLKVSNCLKSFGKAGILDCHSFPSSPLPTDDHLNINPPDFCLGFDDFHAPYDLMRTCQSLLSSEGFTVNINSPYSGCLIPSDFYRVNPRVLGLMVEVNRRTYMDEETGNVNDQFVRIQKIIKKCVVDPFKKHLINF